MNAPSAPWSPPALLEQIKRRESEGGHRRVVLQLGTVDPGMLERVLARKDEIQKVASRDFESLIAELLRADGYDDVQLIPRHNAPGPDIIAKCRGPSGQLLEFIVECKRWQEKVGIEVLRSVLYRLDYDSRSTGAIIATTSSFTSATRAEVDRLHRWRVSLKDADDIRSWIERHAIRRQEEDIIHCSLHKDEEGSEILAILSAWPDNCDFFLGGLRLRAAKNACQICGGAVVCGYISFDRKNEMDYDSRHFHLCIGCLAHSHQSFQESDDYWGPTTQLHCPWCDADILYHDYSWLSGRTSR